MAPWTDEPIYACPTCKDSGYEIITTTRHHPLSSKFCREIHDEAPWQAASPCRECQQGQRLREGVKREIEERRKSRPPNRRIWHDLKPRTEDDLSLEESVRAMKRLGE
jgi:hypothetical protein